MLGFLVHSSEPSGYSNEIMLTHDHFCTCTLGVLFLTVLHISAIVVPFQAEVSVHVL